MRKSYRHRLYPTKSQRSVLNQTLELCRQVYNDTLGLRKVAWENDDKSIFLYEPNSVLVTWKAKRPELKSVYSQVLQNVQVRVDLALKAFFRRSKPEKNQDTLDSKAKVALIASPTNSLGLKSEMISSI
ncbi:Helix-turn-helix domain protein [uncultured archaeon]|nr:Helix-turn-helix domain protein [uncultured archaeon]